MSIEFINRKLILYLKRKAVIRRARQFDRLSNIEKLISQIVKLAMTDSSSKLTMSPISNTYYIELASKSLKISINESIVKIISPTFNYSGQVSSTLADHLLKKFIIVAERHRLFVENAMSEIIEIGLHNLQESLNI